MQYFPLPFGQIVSDSVWGNITARQETHAKGPGLFHKLRFGVARFNAQLNDHLGSSAPSFHETPAKKCVRDELVPGQRSMIFLEILYCQAKRQGAVTPDFEPIIKDGHTYRTACDGVVTMTEGIYQCLP